MSINPEGSHSIKIPKKIIVKNLLFPKRSWTEEQDELLIELVEKYGPHKWSHIARFVPHRMGKQCRQRWFNHLDPTINKEKWTEQEEWTLFLGYKLYGSKWCKLSKILAGRTDNGIKNHWNSIMKKKVEDLQLKFQAEMKKHPLANSNKAKIIAKILNIDTEGDTSLASQFENDSVKVEQTEITEPQMILKKSTESDEMSFDNILKRLERSDNIKWQRLESYNYDCALQDKGKKLNSSITEREEGSDEKIKNSALKMMAVQNKENMMDCCEDLFQQVDNIPLPPLLLRQSSIECKLKFLPSPYKPI